MWRMCFESTEDGVLGYEYEEKTKKSLKKFAVIKKSSTFASPER